MKNWNIDDIPGLDNRLFIVTGANSGIGFEQVKALAAKNAQVVMACRNRDKANDAMQAILAELPEARLEVMHLDLADLSSVRAFADAFREKYDHLDVLINNAGVMVPPFGKTKDGFELQFGSNHLGHFALTACLLDLLEASEQGRVVNLSSMAHKFGKIDFDNLNAENGYSPSKAYAQSKLANLLFTYELERRLARKGSKVRAFAAHPGWSATNLQNTTPLLKLLNPVFAQSAEAGALPALRAATQTKIESGTYWGPSGFLEMKGSPVEVPSNVRSHNEEDANRLWAISEQLTGQPFLAA